MAGAGPFRWTSASRCHPGLVREVNEDACLERPEIGLWAVADGMGGHALGALASRTVVDALGALLPAGSLAELAAAAWERLQAVNRQLRAEAALRDVRIIGSTAVVLLAWEGRCVCLWAGDSRIYLYRAGQLTQLTRDHSQVEELLARGALSPEEAADHPLRNLITRAVGADDLLEVDEETLEVNDGDIFLLCSDGLSNEVGAEQMAAALAGGDCGQAAEVLMDLALKHGGRDNISVVVVRAEDVQNLDKTIVNPVFL
ncbi:MAG TPA: protein phosphatase 2C domain-containing protein [Rhodocyclaceae bacterium]|nr:protein phosphatase 2C domain-containing protein [Rhodocyclaceae bacterium]